MAVTPEQRRAFGLELRRLREDAKLRREDIALAAGEEGVSAAAVGAWERGEYAPRHRETAWRIEDRLGVARGVLAALLGYDGEPDGPSVATQLAAMVAAINRLADRMEMLVAAEQLAAERRGLEGPDGGSN